MQGAMLSFEMSLDSRLTSNNILMDLLIVGIHKLFTCILELQVNCKQTVYATTLLLDREMKRSEIQKRITAQLNVINRLKRQIASSMS